MAMLYQAPWWLPGGNLQTIYAALRSKRYLAEAPSFSRERWTTPDDDFVDVDFARHASADDAPLLVVFHGLEGSSASHYAEAFADVARVRGWACAVPHFRGCSGEINRAPRAYHSGDFEEIDWILRRFRRQHAGPLFAVGISLGGNALMRWAGEMESAAGEVVAAVASVCSPLDLVASGHAIGRGFNRLVYTRMFLSSMVPKALKKLEQHPACSMPTRCWRRATCTLSTTSSRRRCTVFRTPTIIGHGPRPSRTCGVLRWRRWLSMRSTTPSSRPPACRKPPT